MELDMLDKPVEKIKILIVDDELPFLQFLKEVIRNAGYSVVAESNPLNVANIAIGMQPDLIFLDVSMPQMNGFDVFKQLKKLPQTKNTPVIFLTINDQLESKIAGLDIGCVDYLIKSLNSKELLARVKRHLEISSLRSILEQQVQDKEKQLEELKSRLKESEQFIIKPNPHYQEMISSLQAGVVTIDENLICIAANNSAAYLLGYTSPNELVGRLVIENNISKTNRRSDFKYSNNQFRRIIGARDIKLLTKNNQSLPVLLDLIPSLDKVAGNVAVISFTNASLENSLFPDISAALYKDELTGLSNKAAFYRIIRHYKRQEHNDTHSHAVYLVDLDNFKEINDGFGHLIGDEVLSQIASRLRNFVRKEDTVSRLGGDEFGLILEKLATEEDIKSKAEDLLKALSQPIFLKNATIIPSACIGITMLDKKLSSAEVIVDRADMALYKAKNRKDKKVSLFQSSMIDEFEDEIFLEKQLPVLIENNQLYIEYQPQFSMPESRYIGAEALIRWNHPSKGRLLPINFLPAAEKRGFIRDISNYSLKKVFQQIKKWKQKNINFGVISINICSAQLSDSNFLEEIKAMLKEYNVSVNDFVLELTESTLLNITEKTKEQLIEFSKAGVKFAIDDFGKGFSSMQLLKDMDSDFMKIDRDFIQEIETNEKSRIIIKSIIALSKKLNIHVVAEGVENKNQLDFLKDSGCSFIQGFYLGKSVSPDRLQANFFNS